VRLTNWIGSFHHSLKTQFDDVASATEWQNPSDDLVQFCCDKMDQSYDDTETIRKRWEERPGQLFKATQVGTTYTRKEISQTKEWERTCDLVHKASDYIQHGPKSIRAIGDSSSSRPTQVGASSSSSSRNQSNPQRSTRNQQDQRGRPQGSRSSQSASQNLNVHVADDIDVYSTPRRSRSSTQWPDERSRPERPDNRSSSHTQRHGSGRDRQDRDQSPEWGWSKNGQWYSGNRPRRQ